VPSLHLVFCLFTSRINSIIFGRAIKNEYLALGTLGLTGFLATSMMGGKKETAAPTTSAKPTLEQVKDAVKFNAGSRYVQLLMPRFSTVHS
jgi:F-type H+-transporting ATPase subunit k